MSTSNPRLNVYDDATVLNIKFSLMSGKDIRNQSVVHVVNDKDSLDYGERGSIYDRAMGPVAKHERCGDKRCNQTIEECPGHFGHHELGLAILHPWFADLEIKLLSCFCNNMVTELVPGTTKYVETMCMCPLFSKTLLDKYKNLAPAQRFIAIAADSRKVCTRLGARHEKQRDWLYYTDKAKDPKVDPYRPTLLGPKGAEEFITAGKLQEYLTRMPVEAVRQLGIYGFNPEDLVLTVLPIVPNTVRLPEPIANSGISHSGITRVYQHIIKHNTKLKEEKDKLGIQLTDYSNPKLEGLYKSAEYKDLCLTLLRLYDNKDDTCRDGFSAKGYKTIVVSIDGKGGIFRKNLMGARCGFWGRSVVVPDVSLRMDQIGIPQYIASTLTTPLVVTEHNKTLIRTLIEKDVVCSVQSGPNRDKSVTICLKRESPIDIPEAILHLRNAVKQYKQEFGDDIQDNYAKYLFQHLNLIRMEELDRLFKLDIQISDLEREDKERIDQCMDNIHPGDEIVRQLMNGDIGLASRQPILHKESIMAVEAVIKPYNGIGLNLTLTSPYNADFDGDEMGFVAPQTIYSQADVLTTMHVSRCIVSEQGNKPVMALVQDALLGIYLITRRTMATINGKQEKVYTEENIDRGLWENCVTSANRYTMVTSLKRRCIKYGINPYSGRGLVSILFPERFVYDKKGKDGPVKIREGILLEGSLESTTVGLSQNSIHQVLVNRYGPKVAQDFLTQAQFLCNRWMEARGFSLGYADMRICPEGRAEIERTKNELVANLNKLVTGSTNPYDREREEADLLRGATNMLDSTSTTTMKFVDKDNAAVLMAEAGSKGNNTSITQMLGMSGQVTVKQQRIQPQLNNKTRIDVHDLEDEGDPISKGLCLGNYSTGLSQVEVMNQAAAVRQAMADIALHTGEAGYIQRKMVFFLLNVSTRQDGSVRNSDGSIVQFLYGGDGLNPLKLQRIGAKARFVDVRQIIEEVKMEIRLAKLGDNYKFRLEPRRAFLTAFEEAKILALRAEQINAGSYSKYSAVIPSPVLIAARELKEGLIPDITLYRYSLTGNEVAIRYEVEVDAQP